MKRLIVGSVVLVLVALGGAVALPNRLPRREGSCVLGILRGYAGALVAVLTLGRQRYLHVIYRELNREDGFIITAFIARKINRNALVWPKRS